MKIKTEYGEEIKRLEQEVGKIDQEYFWKIQEAKEKYYKDIFENKKYIPLPITDDTWYVRAIQFIDLMYNDGQHLTFQPKRTEDPEYKYWAYFDTHGRFHWRSNVKSWGNGRVDMELVPVEDGYEWVQKNSAYPEDVRRTPHKIVGVVAVEFYEYD